MRPLERIYQIAFLVDDLRTAIATWTGERRAGPFYVFDHFAFKEPRFLGQEAAPDISIALGFGGHVHFELIEVHGDAPSPFTQVKGARPVAHHMARLTDRFDEALATLNPETPCTFTGMFEPAVRMAFIDTRATLGLYTELIEFDPMVDAMLSQMEADHRGWDGRDPVRRF